MESIKRFIEEQERKSNQLVGQLTLLKAQIETSQKLIEKNIKDKEQYLKAVEVLNVVQKTMRDTIKDGFESLVTSALQTVFGETYKFEIVYDRRGNFQEIDFVIKRPDLQEPVPILDTSAGGQVDIVTIALRIILLELVQQSNKSPLILDEAFKHVSKEYIESAGEFLKSMYAQMGRQIIFVTHEENLAKLADNTVQML